MSDQSITCHFCQHSWTYAPPLSRRAECPACRRDARICLNCRFFDHGAHHECREEQAEFVQDKEMGNFCSFFDARSGLSSNDEAKRAKAKLGALFGADKPISEPAEKKSLSDEIARFLASKK
jgi:hypothetical protein